MISIVDSCLILDTDAYWSNITDDDTNTCSSNMPGNADVQLIKELKINLTCVRDLAYVPVIALPFGVEVVVKMSNTGTCDGNNIMYYKIDTPNCDSPTMKKCVLKQVVYAATCKYECKCVTGNIDCSLYVVMHAPFVPVCDVKVSAP